MTRLAAVLLAVFMLGGCTPLVVQQAGKPPMGFAGPRLETESVVSFDGARLPLREWKATREPWAVVVALHGMNDYSNAFHLAAPWWAEQGVTTYAYDQRGFGAAPGRGVWAGDELMTEDLRTVASLVRRKHPQAILVVMGESMGGAVAAEAFASDRPPAADRLVLLSPAVWGWKDQPIPNRTLLWFAANFTGPKVYSPPKWLTSKVSPTDNREELFAMGRDPLMIWGARSDTIYGLVSLMGQASDAVGQSGVPTAYFYGAHDQIIPKSAALRAAAHLRPGQRSAYYAKGWHLLTRDRQGPVVWQDILSFIRDPVAPFPSGAPPIPRKVPKTRTKAAAPREAAGL
jgi:alpha-beta hydrolase superfamily lysophospholipase